MVSNHRQALSRPTRRVGAAEEMEALPGLYAMKDSSGSAPPPELARGEMKDGGFGGDSASGGPVPWWYLRPGPTPGRDAGDDP